MTEQELIDSVNYLNRKLDTSNIFRFEPHDYAFITNDDIQVKNICKHLKYSKGSDVFIELTTRTLGCKNHKHLEDNYSELEIIKFFVVKYNNVLKDFISTNISSLNILPCNDKRYQLNINTYNNWIYKEFGDDTYNLLYLL